MHPGSVTPESVQPVSAATTETTSPRLGIALCLSGGGYRAMLFHLGTLWRLNQLGFLRKLARISSVSGGSITAAVLGLAWKKLEFDNNGISADLEELVIKPVRLPNAMDCPFARTIALANVATRLKAIDATLQERIINWGYAVCDAALRKHVDETLPPPVSFPYPATGV